MMFSNIGRISGVLSFFLEEMAYWTRSGDIFSIFLMTRKVIATFEEITGINSLDFDEKHQEMTKYKPDGWQQRHLNWRKLRGFGKSKVASLTIAAPFVGYVILYHDMLTPYLGGLGGLLQSEYDGQNCGPWISFIVKLNFVYLGLLSLGIGTIIYRVFADQVIQFYSNVSDYVEREEQHITARNLRSMFVTVKSRRSSIATPLLERAPWLDRNSVTLKAASIDFLRMKDPNVSKDLLRSYYNVLDRYSDRFWVVSASVAFGVGFTLLAIPGLLFTGRVLCTMLASG